jgi:hypothetical protein
MPPRDNLSDVMAANELSRGVVRKLRLAVPLVALTLTALTVSPVASSFGATAAEVDAALERAKAYLYSKQDPNGTWEIAFDPKANAQSPANGQYTGPTAIAVYALLSAGERPSDPRLVKAIEFVRKTDTLGVYALGLRCQLWLTLPQTPENKARMKKDMEVLLRSPRTNANAQGMFNYTPDKSSAYSHSRSQYGVLGVWAAERSGQPVPETFWPLMEKAWIRNQDPSGGWTYTHPSHTDIPVTPGMTAAGVATLFITQDYTNANAGCGGNVDSPAITKGMAWMASNMDKVATDQKYERAFQHATLYAVERIGVAAGVKYIGGVDWYQKGADWLLKRQNKDGSWLPSGLPGGPVVNASFPVLFLARGRAPVVVNKLDFTPTGASKPAAWNQRPRDVANVVRWIGTNIERDLGWQSVDLKAPLKDLAEAPILYLSGSDELELTRDDTAKLKAFVETGGLILGHADCGKPAFATAFRKLAGKMYPTYEFRELPAESPVYSVFPKSKWKRKPSVLSVSNGVREIIMLIPAADPGKAWQTRQYAGKEELYQLGADIVLYATNKEKLQYRGESYVATPDEKVKPTKTIDVARVKYEGNWDPEPGGWRRLAALIHNQRKIGVNVTVADGDLGKAKFAHLTGTAKFVPKPAQIDALTKFVDGGGTLLIEAAGGNAEFALAAEALATQVAPGGKLAPLAPDAPVFKANGVTDFSYRAYARINGVGTSNVPRLQAIDVKGRPAVIVSRDDLSAGLLGPEMDGVIGYEPDTAVNLMTAMVLHSAGMSAPPPAPAPKAPAPKPAEKK